MRIRHTTLIKPTPREWNFLYLDILLIGVTKENWDDRKMSWMGKLDVTLFVPFFNREEGAQWRLQTKTTSLSVRIHYGFLMTRGEYVSRLLGAILRSPPNLKAYTSTHFSDHLCQFLLPNCQEASLFIFIYCALYTKNCLKHGVGMVWKKIIYMI